MSDRTLTGERMSNATVLLIDNIDLIGDDLRWALRLVAAQGGMLNIVVVGGREAGEAVTKVDLAASKQATTPATRVALTGRKALNDFLGEGSWTPTSAAVTATSESAQGEQEDQGRTVTVAVSIVPRANLSETVTKSVVESKANRLIVVGRLADRDHWGPVFRRTLRSVGCAACAVIPGPRREAGGVLVAAGRGSHGRAALIAGSELAEWTDQRMTAIHVQPDIGPDAVDVGQRILDRRIGSTKAELGDLERRVIVNNDTAKGIVEAAREESYDVLVLGATRGGAVGEKLERSVPARIFSARPDITLVAVRHPVARRGQFVLWLRSKVHSIVPQLDREGRIELVERIQSSSQWNFDFIVLMALSTIIAALGLLDDSAAVIIGAMLVAPLMTPLLGIGLAVAQGNAQLARITIKSATLGFITAYGLGLAIGLLTGEFKEATPEMRARDWPQMIDLVIAFASGLAASYASARPSLLAALPGVAIAAALVPPIVSAGLATSIGEFDLAFGALLLFIVNMVVIVAATAIALWSVGIVFVGKGSARLRHFGRSIYGVVILMALGLALSPPQLQPRWELRQAVNTALDGRYRLRRVRLGKHDGERFVQMDLGGRRLPNEDLEELLLETVHGVLGDHWDVRLTFRYEATIK